MFFNKKQRFSFRKLSVGLCSVLLGTVLVGGAVSAQGDDLLTKQDDLVAKMTTTKDEQSEPVLMNTKVVTPLEKAIVPAQEAEEDVNAEEQRAGRAIDDEKTAAKTEIETAGNTKKQEFTANQELTTEERTEATDKVTQAVQTATTNITNAATEADVTKAKTEGLAEINSIEATPVAKPTAKTEIETAGNAKKQEITDNQELTTEERTEATNEVTQAIQKATTAITNATTDETVTQAKTEGLTEINSIEATPVTKPEAKKEIETTAEAKKKAIEDNQELSEAEKTAAINEVTQAVQTANDNITQADTKANVEIAKTAGITTINTISVIGRDKAKEAIQEAVEAKNKAIDENAELNDQDKQTAKAAVQQVSQAAINQIEQATSQADVTDEKEAGLKAIAEVPVLGTQKAKADLEQAADAKKQTIEANQELTSEEKAEAIDQVTQALQAATKEVDQAVTQATINTAKETGLAAIEAVEASAVVKPAAKAEIEAAAKAKNEEIEKNQELSDKEKEVAKQKVAQALQQAIVAIATADTNAHVAQAKQTGITAIQNVPLLHTDAAKAEIDEAVETKNKAIDTNPDLNEQDKQRIKEAVLQVAQEAKNKIDASATQEEVTTQKEAGLRAIEAVRALGVEKAKAELEAEAAIVKAAIANDSTLTDSEKAIQQAAVDKAVEIAKAAIDQATTQEEINLATVSGIEAIRHAYQTNTQVIDKESAKAEIDAEAIKVKDKIDNDPTLSVTEKAAQKAAVDKAVIVAKEEIDRATTQEEVMIAKERGIAAINQAYQPNQTGNSENHYPSNRPYDPLLPGTGTAQGMLLTAVGLTALIASITLIVRSKLKKEDK